MSRAYAAEQAKDGADGKIMVETAAEMAGMSAKTRNFEKKRAKVWRLVKKRLPLHSLLKTSVLSIESDMHS